MEINNIKPEILKKLPQRVVRAAEIRGAGIKFTVSTCICIQQVETKGIKGSKAFDNYEDALAAVIKWQNNVISKYKCGSFAQLRGYYEGLGWSNLIGYTTNGEISGWQAAPKKHRGLPIFAKVVIICGVDR